MEMCSCISGDGACDLQNGLQLYVCAHKFSTYTAHVRLVKEILGSGNEHARVHDREVQTC